MRYEKQYEKFHVFDKQTTKGPNTFRKATNSCENSHSPLKSKTQCTKTYSFDIVDTGKDATMGDDSNEKKSEESSDEDEIEGDAGEDDTG